MSYIDYDAAFDKEMALKEWLDYWFDTYSRYNVKRSTAISYRGYIDNHFCLIGDLHMSAITTDKLQRFFNRQYNEGSAKGGGLSPKTLQNMKRMLHKSLGKAVDLGIIEKNYSDCIELPRQQKQNVQALNVDEQQRLIREIKLSDKPLVFGVYISLKTGLRLGEVLGLQWRDIDFDNRIIHVRRAVNRLNKLNYNGVGTKTELRMETLKSDASYRDIPVTESLIKKFGYEKAKLEQRYKKTMSEEDFVISSRYGYPAEPKTLQKTYLMIAQSANISNTHFHCLRHTFATRAIEKGADPKTVSVLLGHADVSITLNRYTHVMEEQKRKTMEMLLDDE